MQDFGGKISELRRRKDWTQDELAQRVGVSAQAVSKWETGQSMPDIALLSPLADAFGVSVDALLNGTISEVVRAEEVTVRQRATQLVMRVVDPAEEGPVTIKLPLGVVRFAAKFGSALPGVNNRYAIDTSEVMNLIEHDLVGEVLQINAGGGATVTITLE